MRIEQRDMDQIRIDDLCVFAHHGVYDFEQKQGQEFLVSAVLYTDLRKAGCTDSLEESTDYGEVCCFLEKCLQEHTFRLIEAAAERTAEETLQKFPRIEGIMLELKKPSAPIRQKFQSVSVKITRFWHTAYLSYGSNMGDREAYIRLGLECLNRDSKIRMIKCSDLMKTKPYGGVEQDDFLNGACMIKTLYLPGELLHRIHEIEAKAGRERVIHWGPRTLDMDILFYDDILYEDEELTIPHPDLQNRLFVLKPMEQIAPHYVHPVCGLTVRQLLNNLYNPKTDH